jgi:CRP-like cAMP-binding protein
VFQVIEEDPDSGTERVLRILGRGESFGELGLIGRSPRAATVKAVEDGELFLVDKSTFDRLLAGLATVPDLPSTLQAAAELRALPAFASLGSDDLADVLAHGAWVNVAPEQTIIEQGEEGDAFYAIRSGQVDAVRDGEHLQTSAPARTFGRSRSADVLARRSASSPRLRTPVPPDREASRLRSGRVPA